LKVKNQVTMRISNSAGQDTLLRTGKVKMRQRQKIINLKMNLSTETMIIKGIILTEGMKTDSAAKVAIIIKKIVEANNAEIILLGIIEKQKKVTNVPIGREEIIRKVDNNEKEAIANTANLVETVSMGANVSMVAMGSSASMEMVIIRNVNDKSMARNSIKSKSILNQITESITAMIRSFS